MVAVQTSQLVHLAVDLTKTAAELNTQAVQEIVALTAAVYAKAVTDALSEETGGSMRLRVGPLEVVSQIGEKTALIKVQGPWWLVDQKTGPHVIRRRGGGRRRGRGHRGAWGRPALRFDGDVFRREVHHPGTRGKQLLAPALENVGDDLSQVAGDVVTATLREGLG